MNAYRYSNTGVTETYTVNPKTNDPMPWAFDGIHANYLLFRRLTNEGTQTITKLRVYVHHLLPITHYPNDDYIDESLPIYYAVINSTTAPGVGTMIEIDKIAANCVYYDSLVEIEPARRILLPGYEGKPTAVTFDIPVDVPSGHSLYLYIHQVKGKIFDNSSWELMPKVYSTDGYNVIGQMHAAPDLENSWDINGNPISTANTLYTGRYHLRTFTSENLADLLVKAGDAATASVPLARWTQENATLRETLYIQLPEWMEMNGTPYGNSATTAQTLLDNTHEYYREHYNTYVQSFTTYGGPPTISDLIIPYKSLANGTGSGQFNYGAGSIAEGEIRYWIDWITGNNITDDPGTVGIDELALRPVVPYISKQSQKVICQTTSSGNLQFDVLNLNRITRGLAVYDATAAGLRTPAEEESVGSSAPLAATGDINHETYLPGDTGHVEITATVNAGDSYLNVVLTSECLSDFDFDKFSLAESYVTVSGTNYPATYRETNGDKIYYGFPASTLSSFPAGTVNITIPFEAKATYIDDSNLKAISVPLIDLQSEVSLTLTRPGDLFSPVGQDFASVNWRIHWPFGRMSSYMITKQLSND